MGSFREKNGGLGSKRLIQKQIGAEFTRNDTYSTWSKRVGRKRKDEDQRFGASY